MRGYPQLQRWEEGVWACRQGAFKDCRALMGEVALVKPGDRAVAHYQERLALPPDHWAEGWDPGFAVEGN